MPEEPVSGARSRISKRCPIPDAIRVPVCKLGIGMEWIEAILGGGRSARLGCRGRVGWGYYLPKR